MLKYEENNKRIYHEVCIHFKDLFVFLTQASPFERRNFVVICPENPNLSDKPG